MVLVYKFTFRRCFISRFTKRKPETERFSSNPANDTLETIKMNFTAIIFRELRAQVFPSVLNFVSFPKYM